MTCDEAEILLHALIDGELDAGHVREIEAHVATCPKCTALLKDYQEMSMPDIFGEKKAAPPILPNP